MAELILKIEPGAGYEDGDVLCAFNRRAIRCCHAQHICHVRQAQRNGSGLILTTDVARDWYEATHQYRFNRASATEVMRTEIATDASELFGPTPNERGEAIDVRLFIRRRKLKPDHHLFGEDGAEIWYGGNVDTSNARLDRVWTAIETKTPNRRTDFPRWPMGRLDVRHHLPIRVDEFDDDARDVLVSQELDATDPENPVLVKKRRHRIDWRNALQLTDADRERVLDRSQEFDLREVREFTRTTVVQQKERVR